MFERYAPNPRFWEKAEIPNNLDVKRLLPPTLPNRHHFETLHEVSERAMRRERQLRKTPCDHMAVLMEDCRAGLYPCRQPICPRCSRRFRRWFGANTLDLASNLANPVTVTLYCESVPQGELERVEIPRIHARIRQRFRRTGLSHAVAVGGTEADYRVEHRDWLIHLHLLLGNVDEDDLRRLREAWRITGIPAAMRVSPIRNLPRQVSYLQKFTTFHRPGKPRPGNRARAYPLPNAQFEELALWLDRYDFPEFIFMVGARRRGTYIMPLETTN